MSSFLLEGPERRKGWRASLGGEKPYYWHYIHSQLLLLQDPQRTCLENFLIVLTSLYHSTHSQWGGRTSVGWLVRNSRTGCYIEPASQKRHSRKGRAGWFAGISKRIALG